MLFFGKIRQPLGVNGVNFRSEVQRTMNFTTRMGSTIMTIRLRFRSVKGI